MAEINMEDVAVARHHKVIIVAITEAEDVGSHAVGGSGDHKALNTPEKNII